MDTTKVHTAINAAHEALNAVIDGAVKSRNVNGIRSLTLAANTLQAAEKHLENALKQSTPKEKK